MKQSNITGKKFNRLTAIKYISGNRNKIKWLFRCDCGKEKIINKHAVTSGNTKSCGCLNKETRILNLPPKIHGMFGTRFYAIWANIKYRCITVSKTDKNNYLYYKKRGIKVCDRWLKFENFRDDMYEDYLEHVKKYGEKNTSIDRINNDGNYNLENCKWATAKEQSRNRSNNRYIMYNNKKYIITDLADMLNISISGLIYKIFTNKINARII